MSRRWVWVFAVTGSLAAVPAAAQNLLLNAGFEDLAANGQPTHWQPVDFGTGGTPSVGRGDARSGEGFVTLTSATETQRSCWRQSQLWDPAASRAIVVSGWYRTRDTAAGDRHGASIRMIFNHDPNKWEHVGIESFFFPPSETWREAKFAVLVPARTRAVVIELFHWLTPGATDWDDIVLRPAAEQELIELTSSLIPVDQEPVLGRNLPYSPADGTSVTLNPPPFLWLPSSREASYRVQIATNNSFSGDSLREHSGLSWCCLMLTEPLPVGTWYWRYGVDLDGLPTRWSQVRRFEVTATADAWPYPGREAFQVSAARPRLFVPADRLNRIRRRAADGDLKAITDGLVRSVTPRLGEDLVAEPDFLPSDPALRGPAYTVTFRETRPPMDVMERAGLAYLLTGDEAMGQEARRRVIHFFGWDPLGSTDVFHNDEPAMWVMMRGVRAYDWTWELYTPAEREAIEASMRVRAQRFYELMRRRPFENNPFESHAGRIIGFLGEAALAFLPDWPEAREYLDYITSIYWGVYPAWGKDDGGWNEGPGYWSAYMSFGLHFVVALREATGVDLSKRPFFHNTPYYQLYLSPPYSQMSPFGDGSQFRPSRPGSLMYWFGSLTRDPAIRWYADFLGHGPGGSPVGIALADPELVGQAPVDLPQARLFEGVGLACLHTDLANGDENVMFAMRASPYGAVSHGHNDQNCFVLEAYGEPLAIATGWYNRYGSPHHDKWTRQTKAKCGITHDGGQGQDRGWQATGAITSFVHGEAFDLVTGDATPAYGGRLTRALRQVVHVRPGLFVIADDLASNEPRRWEYQLHALDEMELHAAEATVVTRRPKATLTTRFLHPTDLAFSQTDQFDPPPMWPPDRLHEYTNQWHATASYPRPETVGSFLTVLLPAKAGAETALPATRQVTSPSARAVELLFTDGGRCLVAFRRPGVTGPMTIGELRSDGDVAAIRFAADGRPVGWLLDGGAELLWQGQRLAQLAMAQTVTASAGRDGGRVDSRGPGGRLSLAWPGPALAVTRDTTRLPVRPTDGRLTIDLAPIGDTLQVWVSDPVKPGPVRMQLQFGEVAREIRGQRYGRGLMALSGAVEVPPGLYRVNPPAGATFYGGVPASDGARWIRQRESVLLAGRNLPATLVFEPTALAPTLQGLPRDRLPAGLGFEAEANWGEVGGQIQVSGGGHKNTSGGDNLWAWNAVGHQLYWDLTVPEAGRYQLWFVCASETGLLAEAQIGDGPARGAWFAPTGGWGRSNPAEWQAFCLTEADGGPAVHELSAGTHRVRLTNWSGMGMNVDQLLLEPTG